MYLPSAQKLTGKLHRASRAVCLNGLGGWCTYNALVGDGGLNNALQELYEFLGNTAMAWVWMHVEMVVILRVWRGPQTLRPMWRTYANTPGRR
jgi:hypothetical protein